MLKDKANLRSVTGRESDAEAQVAVAEAWGIITDAARAAAVAGDAVPAPAATDATRTSSSPRRVAFGTIRIIAVPIAAPLPHIANHVVKSPPVSLLPSDIARACTASGVLFLRPS